jgi:hypothetical protein
MVYSAPETRKKSDAGYDGKKVDIFNIGVILFGITLRANPLFNTIDNKT